MKTVWKYELKFEPEFTLMVPLGAKVVHVAMQGNTPCLWVLVDSDQEQTERQILMVGTGHEVPADVEHLGSVVVTMFRFAKPQRPGEIAADVEADYYVWHYFERWPE